MNKHNWFGCYALCWCYATWNWQNVTTWSSCATVMLASFQHLHPYCQGDSDTSIIVIGVALLVTWYVLFCFDWADTLLQRKQSCTLSLPAPLQCLYVRDNVLSSNISFVNISWCVKHWRAKPINSVN